MSLEAVLFDMDGLLLDTERLHHRCWEILVKREKLDFDLSLLQRTIGSSGPLFRNIVRERYGPDYPFDHYMAMKNEIFEDIVQRDGMPVKAGVAAILDYLDKRRMKKYVVTSTYEERAKNRLEQVGFLSRFDGMSAGAPEIKSKPAPDLYNICIERYGLDKDRVFALEDSINGINACESAGINVIAIPDMIDLKGFSNSRLISVLPDLTSVIDYMETHF